MSLISSVAGAVFGSWLRRPPGIYRAGIMRAMAYAPLARCTTRACPVRYASGDDRACIMCREDAGDLGARMTQFTELAMAPGERGGDGGGGQAAGDGVTTR